MNSRNIVVGALAGLAVGTLIGALYNSNQVSSIAGEATRKGKKYSKGIKKVLGKFLNALTEKVDYASEEGTQLLKKGRSEAQKLKEKVEPLMN